MILTESEAKLKRCTPALILLVMEAGRFDALAARSDKLTTNCVGSACMQWAWFDYANAEGLTYRGKAAAPWAKGRLIKSLGVDESLLPARGYCGLTGSRE